MPVSKAEEDLGKQIWTKATPGGNRQDIETVRCDFAVSATRYSVRTYSAAIIASSPGLFLIRMLGPFVEINILALNSVRARVTVSRVTPTT